MALKKQDFRRRLKVALQSMSYKAYRIQGSSDFQTGHHRYDYPYYCYSLCSAGELVWCNLNINLTRFLDLLVNTTTACIQPVREPTKRIQSCLKCSCLCYFTRQTNRAINRPITEKNTF